MNGGDKAITASHDDATTWPRYGTEEEKAVLEVLRKPSYTPIDILEEDWKKHFNLPYCKAHFNGTSAITSMYFALDLPAGSEIMVPCCTFWATITPMRFFDLVPVMIDINPVTLNFDVEDAKRKLTKNTKAVFPVHYLGMPCDMDHISDFCKEKGLILLEDACHAHGASMHGKFMGSWGRMACFSFQGSKPLPALEGGMGNYQNQNDYEQQNRPDVDRVYYSANRFLLNETEAGMSRDACVKALKAEGVSASAGKAQFLCKDPIFHEAKWWHHLPVIADKFPGAREFDKGGISLPYFTKEMPELNEQYITAFEKVWEHLKKL